MNIKTTIDDVEHMWGQGRKEGAWSLALIAAAATARKRYPRPMSDSESFKKFICDISSTIYAGEEWKAVTYLRFYTDNRADHRKLEDIFYHELRCNMVHEAELKDITFSESREVDGQLQATLSVPTRGPGVIPDFWVLHLIKAVKEAPENSGLFD